MEHPQRPNVQNISKDEGKESQGNDICQIFNIIEGDFSELRKDIPTYIGKSKNFIEYYP